MPERSFACRLKVFATRRAASAGVAPSSAALSEPPVLLAGRAGEAQDGVKFDRVRSDPGLAVIEVEEADAADYDGSLTSPGREST